MPDQSLTITDNRTGKTYTVPVADGCIRAMDLRQIKTEPGDFGTTCSPSPMEKVSRSKTGRCFRTTVTLRYSISGMLIVCGSAFGHAIVVLHALAILREANACGHCVQARGA